MRGSVRQFAILLLAAIYAVLWTCGSAWHLAHCTHSEHASGEATRDGADAHCCRDDAGASNCSHSHKSRSVRPADPDVAASGEEKQSSESPHDSSDCEICLLFAQTLTVVSVVSIEVSPEWVENFVCLIPLTVPECELIPATSRGPPAV